MSNKQNDKSIAKGIVVQGSILAIAGLIVRAIGLIRRIPLQNIIGDAGNGFYSAAYEVYSIILLLSSYSLPLAVSRLVAARVEKGQYRNANKIFKGALCFALISGGLACFFVFIFADFLAGTVMMQPKSAVAMRVLAPTLLIVAIMGVFRGYFQGLGTMTHTAISQIVEQIVLVAVSLVGAYILFNVGSKYGNVMMDYDYAPSLGAAGATIGCGVGALFGLLYLLFIYFVNRNSMRFKCINDSTKKQENLVVILRLILLTIIPVILSTVVYNISNVIDQSVYNHYMESTGGGSIMTINWGVYSGKYKVLVNLPIALANAMCSAIVPSLAASISRNDHVHARMKMATAIRVTMIVTIPSAVGLAVLGKPIVDMLFSGEIDLAAKMLLFGSLSIIFYALSTLGNGILQGIGKLYIPVINSCISLVVHLLSLFVMLYFMKCDIFAVVLSNLIFSVVMCVLNHYAIYKVIGYRQEIKRTFIVPIIASLIMGLITFGSYKLFALFMKTSIACILSIVIAIVAYVILLILLKGLKKSDYQMIPGGPRIYSLLCKLGIYHNKRER